ncbi:peptide chain release factor N(5)-glutamine methyltransferase [Microbaculum marinum]|uniref:Release factor glutamine methyltransferase n=1 Tax=Microbaculum marinum TaxID=1764581 RepID=A0AAW9RQ21_9HYPH
MIEVSPRAAAATVGEMVRQAGRRLAEAGVATPELDARLLVAHAAGLDRVAMIAEARSSLDAMTISQIDHLVARRLAGEPVGRILGHREFWGLDFALGPDTLEPRPDSETVVEAALAAVDAGPGRNAALKVADLGTGTGCLLVALLRELPMGSGVGVDISPGAVEVARRNAQANGVADRARFVVGSWLSALTDGDSGSPYDVIVANPPYIESEECGRLQRDVADHDPILALDGGPDGLVAYREILKDARDMLTPGGVLVLELGMGQTAAVSRLSERSGMAVAAVRCDLGGIERALTVRR